jgi:protein-S-isoprenylcysteine O-methyltransferase Ste14
MNRLAMTDARPNVAAASRSMGLEFTLPQQISGERTAASSHRDLADLTGRMVIVALFSFFAVRIGADFLETGRLTGLLLLASEALVVVLTVLRRAAAIVDRSPRARVLTAVSLCCPFLVGPTILTPLAPDMLSVGVSICGLLVIVGGKLSLGRSFGLMPANRGIVSTGLYRLVRHPIYLGYLVTHVAYFVANPSAWNLLILVTADTALLARAVCEEKTLARDARYRDYQNLVRWRVLPGIF